MAHPNWSDTELLAQDIPQSVQFFYEQFGEAHLYLLCHAAFPNALTPHLLYQLWANFPADRKGRDWNTPWIAIADLLLSPICREVGHELYEIEGKTRNQLLTTLSNYPSLGEKRIDELARFLLAYIKQQLNSTKTSVRNIAQAQNWTALAYLHPEAAARDLALTLTKLHLNERTEWVRIASLAETLTNPLKEAKFEPLLIYLRGMRDLSRGDLSEAESQFRELPAKNNRIIVAGVTLSIPEFQDYVWTLSFLQIPPPHLQTVNIKVAKLTQEPGFMYVGSKWGIASHLIQTGVFYEALDKDVTIEMVSVPGGQFQMGASHKDGDYRECPQHLVTIAPFFMGRYPVTQAQWQAIAQKDKVRIELNPHPSRFRGKNLPVEQITWFEAIEFCERLQLQTGRPYRLPSESEWEYACRAGTNTPFHFGTTISPKLATYDGSQRYRAGPKGKSSKQTTNVGSFQAANAFGLNNMHGNIWEWCADHWYDDYTNAPENGIARVSSNRNSHRVIRGGSWLDVPTLCRASYRNSIPPDNKILSVGFRLSLLL